ncbi:hypothetical protein SCHPADRAFT_811236, partial [Schizopora paradoxa]
SEYYGHFLTPEIFVEKGVKKYRFICKVHPSVKVVRAQHDNSTSNLKVHGIKCSPLKKGTVEEFVPGAKYSKACLRFKLMRWIVRVHRPYAIVEDEDLLDMFRMLYAKVEVPSARTISRDVIEVFEMSKQNLINKLKVKFQQTVFQAYPGKVHIGLDGWTSPNIISFLGIVVY